MATNADVSIKIEDDDVDVECVNDKDPWMPKSRVDLLIEVMDEEVKVMGGRDTGVFQPKSWERMRKEMSDNTKFPYKQIQIKNKFQQLRTLHTKFKQLCKQTGVGWCPIKGTAVAEPEIWEKLFKINDKAKHFKKRGFPYFAAMSRILGDTTATGSEAHPSVLSPSKTDSSTTLPEIKEEKDNDEVEVMNVEGSGKDKKTFDMKALKITKAKASSKSSRKRDSLSANLTKSLSALAESNKRKVDILEAKHIARSATTSANASVTSQDSESHRQLEECMDVLNGMDDLDGPTYSKGMKLLKEDPSWRLVFLKMPSQRKKDFLSSL